MTTSQILLCFVIHILLLFSQSLATKSERTEGRALVKWKKTLFNTHNLQSWSIANLDSICWNWSGISCNNGGDVYKIKLDNFSLSGNYALQGKIPETLCTLHSLDILDLYLNSLEGPIPQCMGNITSLSVWFVILPYLNEMQNITSKKPAG
nr:receptor like protein 30-like [Ipomoea batatas]